MKSKIDTFQTDSVVANFATVQKSIVRRYRTIQMKKVCAFFAPTTQQSAIKDKTQMQRVQ